MPILICHCLLYIINVSKCFTGSIFPVLRFYTMVIDVVSHRISVCDRVKGLPTGAEFLLNFLLAWTTRSKRKSKTSIAMMSS